MMPPDGEIVQNDTFPGEKLCVRGFVEDRTFCQQWFHRLAFGDEIMMKKGGTTAKLCMKKFIENPFTRFVRGPLDIKNKTKR